MKRYSLFAAWCALGMLQYLPRSARAESGDNAGLMWHGVHDSNGFNTLSPGFFVNFAPVSLDVRLGPEVWQMILDENLASKDFGLIFHMRVRKEDIGGGLIVNVPWKQVFTIRASAMGVGDEHNKLYCTADIGADYVLPLDIQKFSLDLIQETGRKQGTMLVVKSTEKLNDWKLEQGISLTRFGDGGFFVRVHYRSLFFDVAHYEHYDYHGFMRTEAGIGVQFNF